jgi:hypothetical protein
LRVNFECILKTLFFVTCIYIHINTYIHIYMYIYIFFFFSSFPPSFLSFFLSFFYLSTGFLIGWTALSFFKICAWSSLRVTVYVLLACAWVYFVCFDRITCISFATNLWSKIVARMKVNGKKENACGHSSAAARTSGLLACIWVTLLSYLHCICEYCGSTLFRTMWLQCLMVLVRVNFSISDNEQ